MENQIKMKSEIIKRNRVLCIDRFRGLSVVWMILGHTSLFWLKIQYQWLYGVLFILFDVIGANAFIFISGLGASLSYSMTQTKFSKIEDQNVLKNLKRKTRIKYFTKSLLILLIAMATNIMGSFLNPNIPFRIWVWMVLQTIAIARIFSYPFLRLNPYIRLTIGILFLSFTNYVNALIMGAPSWVGELFYNYPHYNSPFPFFGFFFIGSALGDWFEIWINPQSQKNKNIDLKHTNKYYIPKQINPKTLIIMGVILTGVGVFLGLSPTSNHEAQADLFYITLLNYWSNITALPQFLVRGTTSWAVYSVGIEIIVISLFIFKEINEKKQGVTETKKNKGLVIFGKFSLTIYLSHHIILVMFLQLFEIIHFMIGFSIMIVGIYAFMHKFNEKYKGKYTLEWLINYIANKIAK